MTRRRPSNKHMPACLILIVTDSIKHNDNDNDEETDNGDDDYDGSDNDTPYKINYK